MRFAFPSVLLGLILAPTALAQPEPNQTCDIRSLQVCAHHILQDEGHILTSPIHARPKDLLWIAPLGVATAVAIHYDAQTLDKLGTDPSTQNRFQQISNAGGAYVPAGLIVAGYAVGAWRKDDYLKQTAVLSGEAIVDGLILNEGLKFAIDRETPSEGDRKGQFWPHGFKGWPDGQSMPSGHSMTAWNIAHVISSRYPSWHTRLIMYSLASTVSATRIVARKHFPSDVLVGGAIGYLVGGYVVHARGDASRSFSLSMVDTPNGRGMQVNYTFGQGRE
jgi:membrane-associated phospholipid phosphatase